MNELIPDKHFQGVGIIDFEHWRPVFRQNWASLETYRQLSIDLVRQRHPFWTNDMVKAEAKRSFEKAARSFMEDTLRMARRLRPNAKWAYYGYPYCYNYTPSQPNAQCDPNVSTENTKYKISLFSIKICFLRV